MAQLTRTAHRRSTPAPSIDPRAEQALTDAVRSAALAPSLRDSRPWSFQLHPAGRPRRLHVRADRTRQLTALDPTGRALGQSVGAALFNARVSLAAAGWATTTDRLPDPTDPDLLAVLELAEGRPDGGIAPLVDVLGLRDTRRARFGPGATGAADIALFRAAALAEDAQLVPVVRDDRPGPAGLTGVAEDLVPTSVRDGAEATLVVLTTARDDEAAWLRAGEALQRVLLEIAQADWVGTPFGRAVEAPPTHAEFGSALIGERWPQSILRIGPAPLPVAAHHRASGLPGRTARP